MPQLDVSTYTSQIFWLLFWFGLLYYFLSKRLLPRLAEILEARQDRIAADLDQAQRLRQEVDQAIAEYDRVIGEAKQQAHTLIQETQAKLQDEAAARQAELDAQLAARIAAAEARIAAAKVQALKELEDAAVVAAQAAAERLAGLKVTKKDAQAALKSVLKEAA
jgi:F-type H+-transporting ATPase subunit b